MTLIRRGHEHDMYKIGVPYQEAVYDIPQLAQVLLANGVSWRIRVKTSCLENAF